MYCCSCHTFGWGVQVFQTVCLPYLHYQRLWAAFSLSWICRTQSINMSSRSFANAFASSITLRTCGTAGDWLMLHVPTQYQSSLLCQPVQMMQGSLAGQCDRVPLSQSNCLGPLHSPVFFVFFCQLVTSGITLLLPLYTHRSFPGWDNVTPHVVHLLGLCLVGLVSQLFLWGQQYEVYVCEGKHCVSF